MKLNTFYIFFLFNHSLCYKNIEDLFAELHKEMLDNSEVNDAYEKLKNVCFYMFTSKLNEGLEHHNKYFDTIKNYCQFPEDHKSLNMLARNIYQKNSRGTDLTEIDILGDILQKMHSNSIHSYSSVSDLNDHEKLIFEFDQNLLVEVLSNLKYNNDVKNENHKIFLLSNIEIDENVLIIVFRALKIFQTTFSREKLIFNFFIFKSADEILLEKNMSILNPDIFDIPDTSEFPFVLGRFIRTNKKDDNQDLISLTKFDFKNVLDIFLDSETFEVLKSEMNFFQYVNKGNSFISNRLCNEIQYYEDNEIHKSTNEYNIINHFYGYPIKFKCESRTSCFGVHDDKDICIKSSHLSIFIDEQEVQKYQFVSFHVKVDGILKKIKDVKAIEDRFTDHLLTDEIYNRTLKNIRLFLRPGFNLYYIQNYTNFDFINNDIIFMNKEPLWWSCTRSSILSNEKSSTLHKIFKYAKIKKSEIDIYFFDQKITCKNLIKENSPVSSAHDNYNRWFKNTQCFKKIEIPLQSNCFTLDYSMDTLFLLENKKDFDKSIYVHINTLEVYKENLKKYLDNAFSNLKIRGANLYTIKFEASSQTKSSLKPLIKDTISSFKKHLGFKNEPYKSPNFENNLYECYEEYKLEFIKKAKKEILYPEDVCLYDNDGNKLDSEALMIELKSIYRDTVLSIEKGLDDGENLVISIFGPVTFYSEDLMEFKAFLFE